MAENFQLSLQVTVLGMGLVILTLLIVAAIIMVLGRIFKPKPEPDSEEKKSDSLIEEPEAASPTSSPAVASPNYSDEAAAIALAIILQRGRRNAPRVMPKVAYEETEVIGEIVNVVSIEPGTGIWAGTNRLQPTR
jgi:sodium pump decarboxylase gamma subunit